MKKFFIILMMVLTLNTASRIENVDAAGIPVIDAVQVSQNALDYIEALFNTLQMLEDYALEYDEWVQMYIEWEHLLERVLSLKERVGDDIFSEAIERHVGVWGESVVSQAMGNYSTENPGAFYEMTLELFEPFLGGAPLDEAGLEELLSHIDDEETKAAVTKRVNIANERDVVFRDTLIGAANVNERLFEYNEQLSGLKSRGNSLDANSDTASIQFNGAVSLYQAQQQLDMMEMLSKIYGTSQQNELVKNMDEIQAIKKAYEDDRESVEAYEPASNSSMSEYLN